MHTHTHTLAKTRCVSKHRWQTLTRSMQSFSVERRFVYFVNILTRWTCLLETIAIWIWIHLQYVRRQHHTQIRWWNVIMWHTSCRMPHRCHWESELRFCFFGVIASERAFALWVVYLCGGYVCTGTRRHGVSVKANSVLFMLNCWNDGWSHSHSDSHSHSWHPPRECHKFYLDFCI